MPNHPHRAKSARQAQKRHQRNISAKSRVKSLARKVRESAASGAAIEPARIAKSVSTIAKAGKSGNIHKRAAARRISRLMRAANKAAKGGTA
ncbi:30S ribosomal protein S20 [bacterium]|nr:30S ribosomal protein S20 [bacterium]